VLPLLRTEKGTELGEVFDGTMFTPSFPKSVQLLEFTGEYI
jgi:hypothetical protein